MTPLIGELRARIHIRVTPDEKKMLVQMAREAGEPESIVLRRVLRDAWRRKMYKAARETQGGTP